MSWNPLSASTPSDLESGETTAQLAARQRDPRDSTVRIAVELADGDSLAAFQPESAPAPPRTRRPERGTAAAGRSGTTWKRAGLIALAVVALLQGAVIAWWIATGTMPWAGVRPSPVTVTSDPAGAPVLIDGVRMGTAPVTASLAAGPHTVQVGEGEAAQTQVIEVLRGTGATVHMALPTVQAAVPAALTGELTISTDPPGADVSIDGVPRGATPLTVDGLTPGTHQVTVARAGTTIRRAVDVEAGMPASVIVSMAGSGIASGWLSVSSPVVADIYENGALIGRTNTPRLLLPVGRHDLDLVNETLGYRTSRTVQIVDGRAVTLQLPPVVGILNINAQPWAEVWIDGERVGETPIGNLSLPIGFHEVVLRHPQFGERRQTVAVGVSAPARVGVDLRP